MHNCPMACAAYIIIPICHVSKLRFRQVNLHYDLLGFLTPWSLLISCWQVNLLYF